MAPELSSRGAYFGPPVDVWALGCFAYAWIAISRTHLQLLLMISHACICRYEVLHSTCAFRADSIANLQVGCPPASAPPFTLTVCMHLAPVLQLRIRRADHTPFRKELAPELRKLIKACFVVDPDSRPTAESVAPLWLPLQ